MHQCSSPLMIPNGAFCSCGGVFSGTKCFLLMVVIHSIITRLCESRCFTSMLAGRWGIIVLNVKWCSPQSLLFELTLVFGFDKNGFCCTRSNTKLETHKHTHLHTVLNNTDFSFASERGKSLHLFYGPLSKCH